jgi:hypothetical protein
MHRPANLYSRLSAPLAAVAAETIMAGSVFGESRQIVFVGRFPAVFPEAWCTASRGQLHMRIAPLKLKLVVWE